MGKKVFALLLVIVVCLGVVAPALAEPSSDTGKGRIKLKVFIHYPRYGRDNPGKPPKPPKPDPDPEPVDCDESSGYDTVTAPLAEWHLAGSVTYQVNYDTIPASVVNPEAAIGNSFATWQDEAGEKFTFVEGSPTTVKGSRYDGTNVVAWANVSYRGAIAVTYTWYYPSTGEVAEVDIIMNFKLPWAYTPSDNPDAECSEIPAFDVQDILTHEVGHWVGLGDYYQTDGHDLTMYGYGAMGELKKNTLGPGDVEGINSVYGP